MMEKSSASEIIKAVLQLSSQLGGIESQLRSLPNDDEQKGLLKALGSIMIELDAGLIRPLVRQHPELDPDRP